MSWRGGVHACPCQPSWTTAVSHVARWNPCQAKGLDVASVSDDDPPPHDNIDSMTDATSEMDVDCTPTVGAGGSAEIPDGLESLFSETTIHDEDPLLSAGIFDPEWLDFNIGPQVAIDFPGRDSPLDSPYCLECSLSEDLPS